MKDYWYQQRDEPLFPDLLWSRPENKQHAGKLLIIGGNRHGMNAPAEAYTTAVKAGIGIAKVLLPESLHKTLGSALEHVEFAPSNISGGFSRAALAQWLDYATWADAVLLAGDTARNSETAMVMEEFIKRYKGKLVITQDCLDQFIDTPKQLFERPDTLIVAAFGQLQKVWPKVMTGKEAIRFSMNLQLLVGALYDFSRTKPSFVITKHLDQIIVAADSKISSTKNIDEIWRVQKAASAVVWWIQNEKKPLEALTLSVL